MKANMKATSESNGRKQSPRSNPKAKPKATAESKCQKEQPKATAESNGTNITSPIVGTAYLAPDPGAKKFVEVGQKVKKGQTIMIVEAMKTMNHVPSTENGTVSKIFVKDGEPVEFGQPLISVK